MLPLSHSFGDSRALVYASLISKLISAHEHHTWDRFDNDVRAYPLNSSNDLQVE